MHYGTWRLPRFQVVQVCSEMCQRPRAGPWDWLKLSSPIRVVQGAWYFCIIWGGGGGGEKRGKCTYQAYLTLSLDWVRPGPLTVVSGTQTAGQPCPWPDVLQISVSNHSLRSWQEPSVTMSEARPRPALSSVLSEDPGSRWCPWAIRWTKARFLVIKTNNRPLSVTHASYQMLSQPGEAVWLAWRPKMRKENHQLAAWYWSDCRG